VSQNEHSRTLRRQLPARGRHAVYGIAKELDVQVVLGYHPAEFAASLRSIAEGEVGVAPMVTAEVPLDGVARAFEALGDPEQHCKIVDTPRPAEPPVTGSRAGRPPRRPDR
jgi:hypothetical protein